MQNRRLCDGIVMVDIIFGLMGINSREEPTTLPEGIAFDLLAMKGESQPPPPTDDWFSLSGPFICTLSTRMQGSYPDYIFYTYAEIMAAPLDHTWSFQCQNSYYTTWSPVGHGIDLEFMDIEWRRLVYSFQPNSSPSLSYNVQLTFADQGTPSGTNGLRLYYLPQEQWPVLDAYQEWEIGNEERPTPEWWGAASLVPASDILSGPFTNETRDIRLINTENIPHDGGGVYLMLREATGEDDEVGYTVIGTNFEDFVPPGSRFQYWAYVRPNN